MRNFDFIEFRNLCACAKNVEICSRYNTQVCAVLRSLLAIYRMNYVHATSLVRTYARKFQISILIGLEVCTHAQKVGFVQALKDEGVILSSLLWLLTV